MWNYRIKSGREKAEQFYSNKHKTGRISLEIRPVGNLVFSICRRSVCLVGVAHIQITHAGAGAESLDPPTDDTVLAFGAQAAQAEVVEHIVDDAVEALGASGLIRAAGLGNEPGHKGIVNTAAGNGNADFESDDHVLIVLSLQAFHVKVTGIGDAGLSVLGEAVDDILALTGVPSE